MLWKYQLQPETAMSNMQSELIALEACCRDLILIIVMVDGLGTDIGLTQYENSKMHVCIHEENAVGIVLAQTLPP